MAPLSFNVHAHAFDRGMSSLWDSYRDADEAVARAATSAKDQLDRYRERIAAGEAPEYALDADGDRLFEWGTAYEYDFEDAEMAIGELRNAFVVAFYHYWERAAQRWGGLSRDRPDHDALVKATQGIGVAIPDRLAGVHHLVNLLKHGRDAWGVKLQSSWPEVLAPWARSPSTVQDWRRAVALTPMLVGEIHSALCESAPPPLAV